MAGQAVSRSGPTGIRLQEIPYLSHIPKDGRSIPVLSHLDQAGSWHAYIQNPNGGLIDFRPIDATAMIFLCKAELPTSRDVHLPLFQMVVQHFSFAHTMAILKSIESDYLNVLASLHKYFVLSNYVTTERNHLLHVLIATELEFVLSNHRSFYDLIHKLLKSILARTCIITSQGRQIKIANMPDSFSKMVGKPGCELANKYNLQSPMIKFYEGKKNIFNCLCKIRNNVIHHGHSVGFIYTFPDGFALTLRDGMWADLDTAAIWPPALNKPNDLVSVLGLLAFVVGDMEDTMLALVNGMTEFLVPLPQAIAEGYRVYLRDHVVVHHSWLSEYKSQQWFAPLSILQRCRSEWAAGR